MVPITVSAEIRIKKYVGALSIGVVPADADAAPGLSLPVGAAVVWTYEVTNPHATPLANVTVRDENGTPADTTDDFSPTLAATPTATAGSTRARCGGTRLRG